MDNFTALVVPLDEFCSGIQSFRSKHVNMPAVAVPPHVSIFYPFYPLEKIDQGIETEIANAVSIRLPIIYKLDGFGVFEEPGVLYLRPRPESLFLELFMLIRSMFPDLSSTFDPPHMHLTISHAETAMSMDELKSEFLELDGVTLPILAKANRLELYQKKDGVWTKNSEYRCEQNGSGDAGSRRT